MTASNALPRGVSNHFDPILFNGKPQILTGDPRSSLDPILAKNGFLAVLTAKYQCSEVGKQTLNKQLDYGGSIGATPRSQFKVLRINGAYYVLFRGCSTCSEAGQTYQMVSYDLPHIYPTQFDPGESFGDGFSPPGIRLCDYIGDFTHILLHPPDPVSQRDTQRAVLMPELINNLLGTSGASFPTIGCPCRARFREICRRTCPFPESASRTMFGRTRTYSSSSQELKGVKSGLWERVFGFSKHARFKERKFAGTYSTKTGG